MSEKALRTKIDLICEEPYRILFPIGILIGMIGVGHWWFYAAGWISSYSGLFHSLVQMQGFMTCFILGFLMTAMPRFSQTSHATAKELGTVLLLIFMVTGFLCFRLWIPAESAYIFLMLVFTRFAAVRALRRKEGSRLPPAEFVWIPIAVLHGITGAVILIFFQSGIIPNWMGDMGEDMATQGFVLSIVAGIGGFMAPRLMGLYEGQKGEEICDPQIVLIKERRNLFHLMLGFLLFFTFWFETEHIEFVSHLFRAAVITAVFFFTGSLPKLPRSTAFFSKLMYVSLWMILIGLWMTAFFPAYEKAALHFAFLSGFGLITFSVATMVVMSHAGEAERLKKPLFILPLVASGIAFALIFRVSAVFFPNLFFQLLTFAAISWILVSASWLVFITPRIFKNSDPTIFERQHEKIKQEMRVDQKER